MHRDRHDRCLERRQRQLGGLAAVEHRPLGVRRRDRRDLHHLRQRLGDQGIGVFLDDITLPDGTSTSFETGLDGWVISGSPEGSAANANDFIRTDASGFPVGNSIATPHSLLLGFGLEGVSTAAERDAVMARALDHLLE